MTTRSITSNQEKQFKRFVEDACERALKEVSPDKDALQRLLERGGEFQAHVVAGIRQFMARLPNFEMARQILKRNFVSPETVQERVGGVVYSDEQLLRLADTVPSCEQLEWFKNNGFALIPRPPESLSLLGVFQTYPKYFSDDRAKSERDWEKVWVRAVGEEPVTSKQWIAIRRKPISGSLDTTWQKQLALVPDTEIVPNAAEVAWAWMAYKSVWGSIHEDPTRPNYPYSRSPDEPQFGFRTRTNPSELGQGNTQTFMVGDGGGPIYAYQISHRSRDGRFKTTGIVSMLKM